MIYDTLKERGNTHGGFTENSRIAQEIKEAMEYSSNWPCLQPHQREALHMIAHKMARIVSGDPDHLDHWHDIAGYATLVEDWLEEVEVVDWKRGIVEVASTNGNI